MKQVLGEAWQAVDNLQRYLEHGIIVESTESGKDRQRSLTVGGRDLDNARASVGPWGSRQEECVWELRESWNKGEK
jgi:hypothetical protein